MFCKNTKANCIFLQETHSLDTDDKFWSNQWGDKLLLCHGTNKSAGVALLFNNFVGSVKNVNKDNCGHWITCVLEIERNFLIIGNVYGYNSTSQNKILMQELLDNIKNLSQNTALQISF